MASITKKPNCKNWMACFRGADGRRAMRTTSTTDRSMAMRVALEYETAARDAMAGRLTEARVRKVLADLFATANRESLPSSSVADFLESWKKRKSLEVSDTSMAAYEQVCGLLTESLGARTQAPVDAITLKDATAFRDRLAKRVSGTTVNKQVKIARVIWNDAMRDSLTQDNPFARVRRVKAVAGTRRAFTLDELAALLASASAEWRGMILVGLYTGQRLGDVARLTWNNIDLLKNEITLITKKTGRPMHIPMAEPLRRYFTGLPSSDAVDDPIFPSLYPLDVATLSGQFNSIAAAVGLARDWGKHRKKGEGRTTRRESAGMSFHCLRHTATSLLKNAGVSDVVAREIIGHDSAAVSAVYTHIESDTLRKAVDKLPDVTGHKTADVLEMYTHTNLDDARKAVAAIPAPTETKRGKK